MKKRIAFQGEHGSFGEEAAHEFFAGESEIVACPTLTDLRRAVETKTVDYAVLPVENSLIGKVVITNDFLAANDWREVGNLYLPIQLHLIGTTDARLNDLLTVTSHPAALAQCRGFFYGHQHLTPIENDNTAASVKRVAQEGDKTRAAIGSRQAAQLFGGKIIQADIQDKQENFTKFLLLKK
jgi:prephenate dehydratase